MVDQQNGSQQAGDPDRGPQSDTQPAPSIDTRERQKIVNLKVTHILLTVFFLWLTYVPKYGCRILTD